MNLLFGFLPTLGIPSVSELQSQKVSRIDLTTLFSYSSKFHIRLLSLCTKIGVGLLRQHLIKLCSTRKLGHKDLLIDVGHVPNESNTLYLDKCVRMSESRKAKKAT